MNQVRHITIELAVPAQLERFTLPEGKNRRLQELLDRQDVGESLSDEECTEAEELVNLAELLSLIRLRATRVALG